MTSSHLGKGHMTHSRYASVVGNTWREVNAFQYSGCSFVLFSTHTTVEEKGTDHILQYPDAIKLAESMLSFITVTPRIFQLRDDALGGMVQISVPGGVSDRRA